VAVGILVIVSGYLFEAFLCQLGLAALRLRLHARKTFCVPAAMRSRLPDTW
jgi:hypothetical protein